MRKIGEVIAIYIDGKPAVYARIEDYGADSKPRWYWLKMLFMTFPAQEVTWILREPQIDGEAFTMNGTPVEIKTVKPIAVLDDVKVGHVHNPQKTAGKVIKLSERAVISKK